jgi:tetraacyldisaccharide 4'-kinase
VKSALGRLFAGVARMRLGAYRRGVFRRRRLAGPVVSVGNLSVGGSGKTPVVRRVAEMLRDDGRSVAVLSRGYGGSFRGEVLVVSDGDEILAGAAEAGDEPVMLARSLPGVVVAVGRRRDDVGRVVEARFGRRVHVLDDGFQHLRLERDLDLVCLDVQDLHDRVLPAGRLREGPEALDRADVILLTRLEAASEEELQALEARLGPRRTFRVSRHVVGWRTLGGAEASAPRRVFLFAGIARPERFEADATASGAEIVGRAFFTDHHRYRAREVEGLAARARAGGAEALVTTAKDAVRLEGLVSVAPSVPIVVLHIAVSFSDEPRFSQQLLEAVGRAA